MAKPTNTIDWAATGNRTEPTSGQKTSGFTAGERLAAKYLNWIIGVTSDWIDYLNVGVFQRESLSDFSPVIASSDRDGRPRHTLGAEGFWMGNAIQEQYRWGPRLLNITTATGTKLTRGDTLELVYGHAQSAVGVPLSAEGHCSPVLTITTGGSSSIGEGAIVANADEPPIMNLADCSIVLEGSLKISDVSDDCDAFFGLHDLNQANGLSDVTLLTQGDHHGVYARVTGGLVYLVTNEGDAGENTATLSGTALTDDEWVSLRIEYHGANTPIGVDNGGAVAKFFVDGAFVIQHTGASVPDHSSAQLGAMIAHERTDINSAQVLTVSTVKMAWNDTLDHDVIS